MSIAEPNPHRAPVRRGAARKGATRKRLARERKTVQAMIDIFCREQHAPPRGSPPRGLCPRCMELSTYARQRLEKCPFGDDKPACAKCPVHCYKPALRERMRVVMRYAGPRMLRRHPLLAIRHLLDERRPAPEPPRRAGRSDLAKAAHSER